MLLDTGAALRGRSASETADQCRELHLNGVIPPYEDILASAYKKFVKRGDSVVDVGVNLGFHLGKLIECVGPSGRVIGFEPVPDFIKGVKEQFGNQATLISKALSSFPGKGEFLYMKKAIGESGFKERS